MIKEKHMGKIVINVISKYLIEGHKHLAGRGSQHECDICN